MKILKTSLFLLLSMPLFAQPGEPLQFEQVSGLSQNTVYSVIKDRQGFLWIATADGLNRYDGVEMKVYKPSAEKQYGKLIGHAIRTNIIEEGEALLFSTEYSLFRFDRRRDIFIPQYFGDTTSTTVRGLSLETIAKIDSDYWFANASQGIVEYNTTNKKYRYFHFPKFDNVHLLQVKEKGVYDNKDEIWFISNGGLISFNIVSHQWQNYLVNAVFTGITLNQDTLYLGHDSQVTFFEINNHSTGIIPFVSDKNNVRNSSRLNVLYTDRKRNIWAGDETGNVFCKEKRSNQFLWKGNINPPSESQYPVYCFYVDEYDVLWAGGDVIGLLRAKTNFPGFNTYPAKTERGNKNDFFINAIYEDENDLVWLGMFKKGLMVLNKKSRIAKSVALPHFEKTNGKDISVTLIKKDRHGNLWIASEGNLLVRENGSHSWTVIKIPIPAGTFLREIKAFSILDDQNGWLIGTAAGLYTLEKIKDQYIFHFNMRQSQSLISDLWANGNKEIWIGYGGSGLMITDKNKLIDKEYLKFDQLCIKSFLADEEHDLVWISTLSGLIAYYIPTGEFKIFTDADGLDNSYLYGTLKQNNELWISTNKGLSKAILAWSNKDIFPSVRFINYTMNDGLPDNEFNTGAFHKGQSGVFYFGSVGGLTWFNPDKIISNLQRPVMRVLEVKVNEENADTIAPEYISSLTLPYFKNNFYFRFRGIEYLTASNVTYAYKMEGLDKDWIYCGKLNEVRYYGMPPANYIFKIKAANGSGLWSASEAQINIIIQVPYWRTWWFYSLTGLLLTAIIVVVTRQISQNRLKETIRQFEKQQAVESERNRISKDMHDEIGSGLTRIALMTEVMHTQQQLDEKTTRGVNEIAESTRQLVDSMSEIIWTLNPQNDTFEDLLAYLREQLNHYFEPLNVNYFIYFPEQIPDIKLSNEQRRNIFLVTKEAINNSLRHSGASRIEIIVQAEGNRIDFSIIDNGKGINEMKKRAGANGLHNMQQRMKDINGSIEWVSENGAGTRVNYSIIV